ncbi:hypothetical protein GGR54DRAFT_637793 [Hypoxylon sp. NC1633]|nr:hypothetical protein GGR54DRAFT_637793 [Hypoxylon sp. NC1633]
MTFGTLIILLPCAARDQIHRAIGDLRFKICPFKCSFFIYWQAIILNSSIRNQGIGILIVSRVCLSLAGLRTQADDPLRTPNFLSRAHIESRRHSRRSTADYRFEQEFNQGIE